MGGIANSWVILLPGAIPTLSFFLETVFPCAVCELGKSFPWQEKHLFFPGLIFCCSLAVIPSLSSGQAGSAGGISVTLPVTEGWLTPPNLPRALAFGRVVPVQGEMLHSLSGAAAGIWAEDGGDVRSVGKGFFWKHSSSPV